MVERGGGAGLAPETLERMRIIPDFRRKKFHRDEAPEFGIFCLVNDAHPAATEFLDDAIVRNDAADHVRNMLVPNSILVNKGLQVPTQTAVACLRLDCG